MGNETAGAVTAMQRSTQLKCAYWLYQLLLHIGLPFVLGLFLWRSHREPLYRAHLRERFGFGATAKPGSVWIFAASLGETRAVSPLIRGLLANGQTVHLTHSSPAGRSEGLRLFANAVASGQLSVQYVPLDLFWALRRAFHRAKPICGLVVESELWPAMLREAARAGVPMYQVNGNLLERSLQRDLRRLGGLRLELFQGYRAILTKSAAHVDRYHRAGVRPDKIHLVGELKFDQWANPALRAAGYAARAQVPPDQKCFLIASSVEGEEELLLPVVKQLLSLSNPPLILWVPRSPQRFDAVYNRLLNQGITTARRSQIYTPDLNGTLPADLQVLVGDSLGEMDFYYAMADLVFVGASLINHGGHNIIEPLALGKPVLMGPSIYGITYPAKEAATAGAFESLPTSEDLQKRIAELLQTPSELAQLTEAAASFCQAHKGAVTKSLAVLATHFPANALALRPAELQDAKPLWHWRNDPKTRAMSGTSNVIEFADHLHWFSNALVQPNRQILIVKKNGLACGMVRFDLSAQKNAVTVSITLSPEVRGTGLSKPLLAQALSICAYTPQVFFAHIRADNPASIAIFTATGFTKTNSGPLDTYSFQPRRET